MSRAAGIESGPTTSPMSVVGPGPGCFRRDLPRSGEPSERLLPREKVRGSNPLSSTKCIGPLSSRNADLGPLSSQLEDCGGYLRG